VAQVWIGGRISVDGLLGLTLCVRPQVTTVALDKSEVLGELPEDNPVSNACSRSRGLCFRD
jgi:hypothetical protein